MLGQEQGPQGRTAGSRQVGGSSLQLARKEHNLLSSSKSVPRSSCFLSKNQHLPVLPVLPHTQFRAPAAGGAGTGSDRPHATSCSRPPRADAELPLHTASLSAGGWGAGGAQQSEQARKQRSPGCRRAGDEALASPARLFQEPPASKSFPLHQQPRRGQAEPL